jgi:hypothetical protein
MPVEHIAGQSSKKSYTKVRMEILSLDFDEDKLWREWQNQFE